MQIKNSLDEYTETEFLNLLIETESGCPPEVIDKLVYFFKYNIKHPDGSDLLMYPTRCGIEDSSEAVISELKRWYAEQGLPCFKSE